MDSLDTKTPLEPTQQQPENSDVLPRGWLEEKIVSPNEAGVRVAYMRANIRQPAILTSLNTQIDEAPISTY